MIYDTRSHAVSQCHKKKVAEVDKSVGKKSYKQYNTTTLYSTTT